MNKSQRLKNDSTRASIPNIIEMNKLENWPKLWAYVIKRAIDDLGSPNIMLAVDALMFFVYNDEDSLYLTDMTHSCFVKECCMGRKKEHGHTKYKNVGVRKALVDCLQDLSIGQEEVFYELLRKYIFQVLHKAHREARLQD